MSDFLNPNVLRDAVARLGYENAMPGDYNVRENLDISLFTQMFSDTTCGMGGVGGQAMTNGNVIVVFDTYKGKAVIYFNNTYAYMVPETRGNDAFLKAWTNRSMPVRAQRNQIGGTV